MLTIMAAYNRLAGGDGPGAADWCARAGTDHPRSRSSARAGMDAPGGVGDPPGDDRVRPGTGHGRRRRLRPVPRLRRPVADDVPTAGRRGGVHGGRGRPGRAVLAGGAPGTVTPNVQALCLAHEAVLHVEAAEWEQATALARRARGRDLRARDRRRSQPLRRHGPQCSLVEARGPAGSPRPGPTTSGASATSPATCTRRVGRTSRPASRSPGRRSCSTTGGGPHPARRGRHGLRVPDAPRVEAQLGSHPAGLRDRRRRGGRAPPSLTTAELRVLHHLPSHLTLAEIADRLFVSRNTVKSQAVAIYRKLDGLLARAAVEAARQVGLLDDV